MAAVEAPVAVPATGKATPGRQRVLEWHRQSSLLSKEVASADKAVKGLLVPLAAALGLAHVSMLAVGDAPAPACHCIALLCTGCLEKRTHATSW